MSASTPFFSRTKSFKCYSFKTNEIGEWLKTVVIDYGRFRECVLNLIDNDDVFLQEENLEMAKTLAELFLEGKVAIYYDTIRSTLSWRSMDKLREAGHNV